MDLEVQSQRREYKDLREEERYLRNIINLASSFSLFLSLPPDTHSIMSTSKEMKIFTNFCLEIALLKSYYPQKKGFFFFGFGEMTKIGLYLRRFYLTIYRPHYWPRLENKKLLQRLLSFEPKRGKNKLEVFEAYYLSASSSSSFSPTHFIMSFSKEI